MPRPIDAGKRQDLTLASRYHFTDIFIPGNGGLDLAVQRSYNSIDDPSQTATPDYDPQRTRSPVGLGWSMHFGRVLRGAALGICDSNFATSSKNPVLELPDGSRQVLYERMSPAKAPSPVRPSSMSG